MADLVHARVDAIRRLARRRAGGPLHRALEKSSPEDIAEAIATLPRGDVTYIVGQLPDDALAGEVMMTLGEDPFQQVLGTLPVDRLLRWLRALEPDDAADLMGRLPDDLRAQILESMGKDEREQAQELMAWPEDSAAGIMSPVAFRLQSDTTCRDAIAALQEHRDVEMVFYLYVENESGQLVGVTSLRQLLLNSPSATLSEIMTPDVVTVHPETDQEEVARIASRYDLLAVPVVDDTHKLLGIVTIDDVLDVVREEAAEDMLKMAGVGEEYDPAGSSAVRAARQRLTWLVVTTVGGLLLSEVLGVFRASIQEKAVLAAFMPVVMSLGGNVGLQTATIMVRNLATGHASPGSGAWGIVFRELRVGMIVGVVLGSVLFLFGSLRYWEPLLGVVVGGTVLCTLMVSAVLGALIPLSLSRVGIDPAMATGPFVTVTMDAISVVLYMTLATNILGI